MTTEYSVYFQDTEGPSETVADGLSFHQCIKFLEDTKAPSRYGVTLWIEDDIEGQWNGEEWLDVALTGVEPG